MQDIRIVYKSGIFEVNYMVQYYLYAYNVLPRAGNIRKDNTIQRFKKNKMEST
jgi:hypothetical protein